MRGLPRRARWLIGSVAVAGVLGTVAVAWLGAAAGRPLLTLVLAVLLTISLVKPLLVFHESESLGIHLDEALLVLMVLTLPAVSTVIAVGASVVVVELYRRPPLAKAVFNAGQRLLCLAAALGVAGALRGHGALTPRDLLAGAAAAATFFALNTLLVGLVIAAVGQAPLRDAVAESIAVRVLLLGGNVAMGLVASLAVDGHPWSFAVALVPVVLVRPLLAGHFGARHDRYRLRGLSEATASVHRELDVLDVRSSLQRSASHLLRGDATLRPAAPGERDLGARLTDTDEWLVVSGRSRNEPLDALDRTLLDALAAVGASALRNAEAFAERTHDRRRLLAITSSLGEGVCALDGDARITFANPVAEALLGPAIGTAAPAWLAEPAVACMRSATTVRSEVASFRRPDGSTVPVSYTCSPLVEHGEAVGAVVAFSDITERRHFEERLTHQAFHDQLTGLPNRRLFLDRLAHALRRGQRTPTTHAVLFLDVDRFKVTNDSLGHRAGDQLLAAVAERISALLRPGDTLARFGGDDFAVLVEDVAGIGEAEHLAARIHDGLLRPIAVKGGHELVASVSIGVALTTAGTTADDIVHDADVALHEAKHRGAGRCVVFDPLSMGQRSAARLRLETDLRRALDDGSIEVHYQPVVDVRTSGWLGAEALVRWRHPTEGLLAPDRFIGVAEETGLVLPLGRLVLEAACRRAREWACEGDVFTVSVNLSARQFRDPGLADDVASVLAITGADAQSICLEITESVAVDDVEATVATLHQLKALGVRLSIDDFGTGYSSLSYLKRFPVDVVKVDKSFVRELPASRVDSAIVAAVVNLATAVGMVTVAEGVETEGQRDELASLGCPMAQGFLFARPMPGDTLTAGLGERRLLGQP